MYRKNSNCPDDAPEEIPAGEQTGFSLPVKGIRRAVAVPE
jgi:hypothetical protein